MALQPLLRTLRGKLHGCVRHSRGNSSSSRRSPSSSLLLLLSGLAVLLCCCATAFSRVVVFFLPLVASTSVCCAAVYLLVATEEDSETGAAAEVVLADRGGEKAEVGILQVYREANATVYGDRRDVSVGCFLRFRPGGGGGRWTKRGVDEDGEDVVFAGRLAAADGGEDGDLEEELVALQVDRLAEGVWDSYFGGCSRWNYMTAGCTDEEDMQHAVLSTELS